LLLLQRPASSESLGPVSRRRPPDLPASPCSSDYSLIDASLIDSCLVDPCLIDPCLVDLFLIVAELPLI